MYGCESWTIKKAEHHRFDAFELWCWRSLLGVPWAARRSNQSMPKEINSDYSLEGWILKLKLQYFGRLMRRPTHWKRPWCWERLKAEGEGEDRGWDDWMASLTQWTWIWANYRRWWGTGRPGMLQPVGSQRVGHDLVTEQQQVKKVKGTVFQILTFSLSLPFLLMFQGWHWLMKTWGTAEPGQIQRM